MNKSAQLQESFLDSLKMEKISVSIFLTNGIKLQGHITGFDQYVVFLKNHMTQMVFKHAISTIVPSSELGNMASVMAD